MLIKYIKNPRTIILSIIPATIDVEADAGLGLIKDYDPDFKRTIGVITKVDMLKDIDLLDSQGRSHIERYLSGDISRNLQLGYGYFAVRNRSTKETQTMSARDGHTLEQEFFDSTTPYKNSEFRSRMGAINLGNKLSEILLSHLRTCLPMVLDEIKNIDRDIESQLDEIGRDYPTTEYAKRSMLNILLHDFQREYNSSIKDRGAAHGTGAKIAACFRRFTASMEKLDPFSQATFTDGTIQNMIRDYNGIHMPDVTISTGIIERCFQGIELETTTTTIATAIAETIDEKSNNTSVKLFEPIKVMKEPTVICIKEVQAIMMELVDTILHRDKFSRFPKMCIRIKEIVSAQIIPTRYEHTNDKINDLFTEETECIWTDDQKFRCDILPSMFTRTKDGSIEPKVIRNVFSGYFNVVKSVANHSIHKKINTFFVNRIIEDINTKLIDHIMTRADINQMLEENKEKAIKRDRLMKMKEKVDSAKNMIICLH
jgi:hypothetical protein